MDIHAFSSFVVFSPFFSFLFALYLLFSAAIAFSGSSTAGIKPDVFHIAEGQPLSWALSPSQLCFLKDTAAYAYGRQRMRRVRRIEEINRGL
jgi:hypothetical protein